MGTGIGSSSYSIYEQGKIDVLLQASSVERRIIFEEAAGISKYRARKNEALRKLQRSEDNVARASDLVAELEKQCHRVRIQAGKARRYREYSERLRNLRLRLAVEDFCSGVEERAELTSERYCLDFHIRRSEGILHQLRTGLEGFVKERGDKNQVLRGLREGLSETRSKRERTEESIAHNRRRTGEIDQELVRRRQAREETELGLRETLEEIDMEYAELAAECHVVGDIRAPRILIADGASFKGNVDMEG